MVQSKMSPLAPHCHCLVEATVNLFLYKKNKHTYQFIVICGIIRVCFGLMAPSSRYFGNLFSDFRVMIHALSIFCSVLGWCGGGWMFALWAPNSRVELILG